MTNGLSGMQVQGQQARHFPLNYVSGTVLAIIILLSGVLTVAALSATDNLPRVFEDDNAKGIAVSAPSVNRPADRGISREGLNTGAAVADDGVTAYGLHTAAREGGIVLDPPRAFVGVGQGEGLIDGSGSLAIPTTRAEALDLKRMLMIEENTYLPGYEQDTTSAPVERPGEGLTAR